MHVIFVTLTDMNVGLDVGSKINQYRLKDNEGFEGTQG